MDKLTEPPRLLRLRAQVDTLVAACRPAGIAAGNPPANRIYGRVHPSHRRRNAHSGDGYQRLCGVDRRGLQHWIGAAGRKDHPALSRDRLSWIQQNYFRAETLIRANARLVEAQTHIPLAQTWGGGEVASADGLRFVVPVRTVHAGPNRKYFGVGKGITYYNFTSNQFTGFQGIVIPGTTHEAPYILEGLLEQQTILKPMEIMADTAAYSDVIFGLFYLLGYQFSPRLADIGRHASGAWTRRRTMAP